MPNAQSNVVWLGTRSPICVILRLINAMQWNKSVRKIQHSHSVIFRAWGYMKSMSIQSLRLAFTSAPRTVYRAPLYLVCFWSRFIFIYFSVFGLVMRFNFVISLFLCAVEFGTHFVAVWHRRTCPVHTQNRTKQTTQQNREIYGKSKSKSKMWFKIMCILQAFSVRL